MIVEIYKDWINDNINPNVYAVLTLRDKIIVDHGSARSIAFGSFDRYRNCADCLMKRLSKEIYGKKAYRRFKTRVPSVVTLEGNGDGIFLDPHHADFKKFSDSGKNPVRYHLNIIMERPDWIPFDGFRSKLVELWKKDVWAMPDVYVEEVTGDCVGYALKEGPETLLASSTSFPLRF